MGYVGAGFSRRTRARNRSASGQAEAKAMRMRLALSTTRAATLSSRRRKVVNRSEEHTSELQSLMRISYAVFCLKNKKQQLINLPVITYRKLTQARNHQPYATNIHTSTHT